MKYLVISDIHGSLAGAQLMRECLERDEYDAVLCLGDILYHGPRNDLPEDYAPKKVIALFNEVGTKIFAVRGNCDGEVDQMVLNFPVLADYNQFLLGDRRVFMSHGHVYGLDHLPTLNTNDVFLSGHTHIPTAHRSDDGIFMLNPGSTSLPKQNHPKTYGVLTEKGFTIYTTDHKSYMSIEF